MDLDYSKILDERSREYFLEAVRCFENECYRATMSTLYCVCMCDIIYKLNEISEEHGFAPAAEILKIIKASQKEDARKETWEGRLLDLVKERTALLDDVTDDIIQQIRTWRHLSAHPALDDDYKLITPKPDTVAGYLKEVYDRLLTKTPLYTKSHDVPSQIAETLLTRKEELKDYKVFADFLEKEYSISKINEDLILKIFKAFWKFELRMVDVPEVEYAREINSRLLEYLYSVHSATICSYFSNPENHLRINRELWQEAHNLFVKCPMMFNFLYDEDKVMLSNKVKCREQDYFAFAWYLEGGDKEAHINMLMEHPFCFNWYSSHFAHQFREYYKADDKVDLCDRYFITKIDKQHDFNEVTHHYFNFLKPYIDEWSLDNCYLFYDVAMNNNQIYDYKRYGELCNDVAKRVLKITSKEELFGKYPHLSRMIE